MGSLKNLFGSKSVLLICILHTNELPLRQLINELHGHTLSNNLFSGLIRHLLSSITELTLSEELLPIKIRSPLIKLSNKVLDDLLTD